MLRVARAPHANRACAGYVDYLLVVDASASVGNIHAAQSRYVKTFAAKLHADFNSPKANRYASPLSPGLQSKVGMITFFGPSITGPNICIDPSLNVREVFGLRSAGPGAANLNAITSAVDARQPASGLTCISCGLEHVLQRMTREFRSGALPVIVLLSDGRQTTCGDANAAISAANRLKAAGYKIAVVTHGALAAPSTSWPHLGLTRHLMPNPLPLTPFGLAQTIRT